MSGFWGSFKNTLDTKGRINFPAKFRKSLAKEDDDTLILIRGTEQCIAVFPLSAWNETIEEIKRKVGTGKEFGIVSRRLMYQASEQKVDKQGRLNLPANLIAYAGLNGEVLVVGYENKIEIWNHDKYREYVELTETAYIKIAEELDI